MEKVTCNELWRDWMVCNSDNPLVLHSKEKISKYSKNDWTVMASEATDVTNMLGSLVLNNVPIESKIAEDAFDILIEHCNTWFFITNKEFVLTVAMLCKSERKFLLFFDRFQTGLTEYMNRLLMFYLHKLPN